MKGTTVRRILLPTVLAVAPMALTGCLLAAGGAAAGGGVFYTTRGVEAVVHGSIPAVTSATQTAFSRLSIEPKGQKDDDEGDEREVFGALTDGDVTVKLEERTENATRVEVTVKTSAVGWDQDMARRILEEIQKIREG